MGVLTPTLFEVLKAKAIRKVLQIHSLYFTLFIQIFSKTNLKKPFTILI
ncbi:hypothetical protein HPMG_01568 [Helicobacter pullorum MIT 98-5489]|uniref:Uncharacterized protein n=1 Tax=Helicobacter pullorum MIT 98-5489 TaxID=537972 RepID=C5F1F9_9HELI|nr:hypothetical protein HPMG_01568 [Helicobacter pullorum MIT 98-5489]